MSKITIILPIIRNTAWKESLESLISGKEQDIEVLCVEKSTGDELCSEYDSDQRIRFIKPEQDAGLYGSVLSFINSDYVYIADPDSTVHKDLFFNALQTAQKNNADLIVFGGEEYEQDKNKTKSLPLKSSAAGNNDKAFSPAELGKNIFQTALPVIYNRIFRADLLKNPLIQRSSHPLYITALLSVLADRTVFINSSLFTRSIRFQPDNYSLTADHYMEKISALDSLYDVLKEQGCDEKVMFSYTMFAVAELNQAVLTPDRYDRRMELYNRLDSYLDKTGILKYPDKDYKDQKAWKRLKGVSYILKAKELVERRENVPESRLLHEASGVQTPPVVSVIIPVYNVEPYLKECLDSICSQTLRDIEIICVDDGSTDDSLSVALAAAEKDSRISVYTQKNAGQSSARNAGAAQAHGEYLYFIDSDDRLSPEALLSLVERARADNLDLLLFDGISFTDEDSLEDKMYHYRNYYLRNGDYSEVMSGPEMFQRMKANGEYRVYVCMQLIRRGFFTEENLWFPHGILHEDNAFEFKAFLLAKRVGYDPNAYYQRRVRADSVMTSKSAFKNVFGYYYTCVDMSHSLYNAPKSPEQYAFLHELYYTVTVLRKRHRSLDLDEQLSYLVFSDEDRRQFELIVDDVERVRASELNYKARLKKTEDERNKLRESLENEKKMNDALDERNRMLLKKITSIGDSKSYRVGQKIIWLPKKIRNILKGKH